MADPIRLFAHQEAIVDRARRQPRLAVFADPGVGKTIATLAVCDERRMPTLVVCPASVIRGAWTVDAEHYPGLHVAEHRGAPKHKRLQTARRLAEHHGDDLVLVTSFETFLRDHDELAHLGIRRLVVDESSRLKNRKAATTKAALRFADRCREVYLLSGTPFPNCPSEAWPQLRAIDTSPWHLCSAPGRRIPVFGPWAAHYLQPVLRFGTGLAKPPVDHYVVRDQDRFTDLLDRAAIRIAKDDCLDLPDKQFIDVRVPASPSERRAYDDAVAGFVRQAESGEITTLAAEATAMKLRQVVGGNLKAGEEWTRIGDSKLAALADLLEQIGPHEPVVIWHQFREEGTRILELLDKLGRNAARCDGLTPRNSDPIAEFRAGALDTLTCSDQSVGHGVTLTRCGDRPCRFAVYYGLGYSYERYAQSVDRIHRAGQTEHCTYYHLVMADTIDEAIRRTVARKGDVAAAVLDELRSHARQTQGAA